MTNEGKLAGLAAWIGREEGREERLDTGRALALAATLDIPAQLPEPPQLPALWHWLYFQPRHRQSEGGVDGHAARGGFLPPVDLPRRMWAGGRVRFDGVVQTDELLHRRSVIESINGKSGRTGELVFVTVRHELSQFDQRVITEWQDIVYREDARPAPTAASAASPALAPVPAPALAAPAAEAEAPWHWRQTVRPDEVLLFRYSALTFNAHRIHYDRHYAQAVEGYPDLVVHGPLQATLLMELLRTHAAGHRVREFRFRGVKPAFCGRELSLMGRREGGEVRLWAQDDHGHTTMEATALLAEEGAGA